MSHRRIGRYEIRGDLGRGTMGEVYRAFDPTLKRPIALKTMAVPASDADETVERFQREAQAAAQLNHPNIVTVHEFGKEGPLLYMAMELLEGTDLRTAIDDGSFKSLDEKLTVADGLLAALEYAHAKGVVHRDIKPANIHLGPRRHVKIMDFGLARVSTSEMTQEGIVLGTPNYMSPEQALGDRVDARTDLFSAGAVLYELVTGHKPFEADTTPSVLFLVVHKDPPPVRRWAPETPPLLCDVVERALQKDREKRFQTATEMRLALARARRSAVASRASGPKAATASPSSTAPPVRPPLPAVPAASPPPLPPHARAADGTVPPVVRRDGAPPIVAAPPAVPAAAFSPELDATVPGRRRASPRGRLAAAGLGLAAVAAIVAGLLSRRPSTPGPEPTPASAQVGALKEALLASELQLARRDLEDKKYADAAREAEKALSLSPGHPEATQVLAEARERLRELDEAAESARQLADRGDTAGASQELSRVLELDPRHEVAADLSTRLNASFRARAEEASTSMENARAQAAAEGAAGGSEFAAAAETARRARMLVAKGQFAEATRAYIDARDGFDRARRAASDGRAATPGPASPPADELAPPTPAVAVAAPARRFEADGTLVATPSSGQPAGFEDVSARKPPEFSGRLQFEVQPRDVGVGDPFVVRVVLVNDGRRAVRVRTLEAAVLADGARTLVPAKVLLRQVDPQRSGLVAEYSGVWRDAGPWSFEAVLTTDRGEKVSSRLRSQP
jgi:serine/threonine-protein kinase